MWVEEEDQHPDERYVGKVAKPTKVMVWAAITVTGRSTLHFHSENVDSDAYCECLEEAFIPALYDDDYLALDKKRRVHLYAGHGSCTQVKCDSCVASTEATKQNHVDG